MGKKSREKRERKEAQSIASSHNFNKLFQDQKNNLHSRAIERKFADQVIAVRSILQRFDQFDAALAIAISDLWPVNAASPIKHILALSILVGMEHSSKDRQPITTYEEFKAFTEALIAACPDFPMLEDYVPEIDWSKVRVLLDDEFVPMFYGSCIERTPDFVEAFRITHADNLLALADMNLAIAIQNHVIRSIPELATQPEPAVTAGYIEVPPSEFWISCQETLLSAQAELKDRRTKSSGRLDIQIGAYQAPLEYDAFGDACLQGIALPFAGMVFNDQWIPIGVRNAPGNTIDVWANRAKPIDYATHRSLAGFVQERFRHVVPGPLRIWIEDQEFDFSISCVISDTRLWLIVCCSHATVSVVKQHAQQALSAMKPGRKWGFKHVHGPRSVIANEDGQSPSAKDVSLLLVLTIAGTTFGALDAPKKPIRLLPLADLITIFDAIKDLDELERL